jgi:hypothetical protein
MHDPGHPGHIDLPDGRALDLRPMYISDKRRLVDFETGSEGLRVLDLMEGYIAILEPAVLWKSWDGPLTDMTEIRLLNIVREWAVVTEDDALPPASGTDSETTSPAPSSALAEESPSPSATPSSR